MPHEQMNEEQAAAYLHMDRRELVKLASRGLIPCRRMKNGYLFRKGQIEHWVESQMHDLPRERLAGIERGVSRHHGFDEQALLVTAMIPPGGLAVPLQARTRDSALRELVDLAHRLDVVYNREELLQELKAREELCSTAIVPKVALPHPRHPLPYDIATSFIVVGLTDSGIAFGAPDNMLSRLFFLICAKDERTHLHVLARLAQMLHEQTEIERLLLADDAKELLAMLAKLEMHTLEKK